MKRIPEIKKLLANKDFSTKVQLYFSTKTMGDDYDPFSKNFSYNELSPVTVRGLVRELSPEALVWKQYGLAESGAVELITDKKYLDWFKNCTKIIIDGEIYTVFKDATGDRVQIQKRSNDVIRVILQKR